MPITTAPPGYVDMVAAEEITGLTAQTITAAVKRGELAGFQRIKNAPWFFRPAELRRWRGLPEPEHEPDFATTGKQ